MKSRVQETFFSFSNESTKRNDTISLGSADVVQPRAGVPGYPERHAASRSVGQDRGRDAATTHIPCATNCAWPFLGRKAGGSTRPRVAAARARARHAGGEGRLDWCRAVLPPNPRRANRRPDGWCVSRRLRLRLRRDTDATSPRTTLASATALPESRTRPRHAVLAPRLPPVRSRRQSERASGLWVAREWSV